LDVFQSLAKDIVKAGPKINANARKEIRQVVGRLGDDLETALDVTILYLRAGMAQSDAKKLADHLDGAPEKLLAYYKEFKVCEGLYGLSDEFKQVFNPKRWAISIRNFWRVPNLVNDLASGERSVLDDLQDVLKELAEDSRKLRAPKSARASEKAVTVTAVQDRLRLRIQDLEQQKATIRKSVRKVTDNL